MLAASHPLFVPLAMFVGALVACQPGINGQLGRRLGSPVQASVVSFSIGALALMALCLAMERRLPRPGLVLAQPWWMALGGGLLGATFVTSALIVAPRIGATLFFALVVAGQMLGALVLDHYGWLGFAQHAISWPRVVGVALVIGGVLLISNA
ncbi:MAG: DMT family transporter [Planctomycetota bacterium]